jgi:hypothetical protein
MNELQKYFFKKATLKTSLKNVKFNGEDAVVKFYEYIAPDDDIEEFRNYDGSDGHYYYVEFITKYNDNYWKKRRNINNIFITTKENGNQIYKILKQTGEINYNY